LRKQWAHFKTILFDDLVSFYNDKDLSPWALGDHVISKGIVVGLFIDNEQNRYLKILIGRFWQENGGEVAELPSTFFGH